MVANNRNSRVQRIEGLHAVTIDQNGPVPKVSLELGAGMSNEQYMAWNIAGAARTINDHSGDSGEIKIALAVYHIHRKVMRSRGFSDADLKLGDKILKQYTGVEA